MNLVAVIFVFLSFINGNNRTAIAVVSGCYTTYVLILQYFLATRNYNSRSLKLHYEQLEIESLRSELKAIEFSPDQGVKQKEEHFTYIIQCYQTSLLGIENHTRIDDLRYTRGKIRRDTSLSEQSRFSFLRSCLRWLQDIDLTIDNILIFLNLVIVIGVVFLMIGLYR